jgi:hypothetical protein
MDVALSFTRNVEYNGNYATLKMIPFQVQLFFVSSKTGAKIVRVITESRPLSQVRTETEASLVGSVVALEAVQRCAYLAKESDVDEALKELYATESLLSRCAKVGITLTTQN